MRKWDANLIVQIMDCVRMIIVTVERHMVDHIAS